jgi:PAS domain S-box-containing protein
MSWVTVIWSMIASACLTLAGIHVLVWCGNRTAWANLLFSLTAVATAAFAFCELSMMRAETPGAFGAALRWAQVPVWLWTVSLVGFVRIYLRAGRPWLAWAACGLRTFALLYNFLAEQNINYREITALRPFPFLGESVAVAEGLPNPGMLVGQLSTVLLLVFVADASVTAWRRGDRRKALMVGGSIWFFLLAALGQSMLVLWGIVQSPLTFGLFYLGLAAAMGYELSIDVLRAAQLARQLQLSERRMDLASDAAGLGIWVRDIVRDEIWATARARSLLGFSESESLNLARFMSALHPDDRDAVRHAIESSLDADRDYEVEFRVQLPDGQTRWIAARGQAERDAKGKPVLMRGVVLDSSARHRSELELQQLQGQLAHADRVSMMGQLASALAHELNQPLGAILRNAEAAELFLQHDPPDLDELRAILVDIRKDDQRAGDVIERLRAMLKRRSIEPRVLAVGDLLRTVAALTRSDAVARHVQFEFEAVPGLPAVMGDRVHLQQVLLNLVLNAMDAVEGAPAGQLKVAVRARRDDEGAVEVAVRDAGHGIPPEKLGLVFEPFFTTKANGMGIGLAVSRTIVEAHGGRIWAENNADRGATFRFTLPVAKDATAP